MKIKLIEQFTALIVINMMNTSHTYTLLIEFKHFPSVSFTTLTTGTVFLQCLSHSPNERQWPELRDLCHTFCMMHKTKKLRACKNLARLMGLWQAHTTT